MVGLWVRYYEKIADVYIDPFGDHDKTDSHPGEGENISLSSGGGGSSWEPEPERNIIQRNESRTKVLRYHVKEL